MSANIERELVLEPRGVPRERRRPCLLFDRRLERVFGLNRRGLPARGDLRQRPRRPCHFDLRGRAAVRRLEFTGLPLSGQEPKRVLHPCLEALGDVWRNIAGNEHLRFVRCPDRPLHGPPDAGTYEIVSTVDPTTAIIAVPDGRRHQFGSRVRSMRPCTVAAVVGIVSTSSKSNASSPRPSLLRASVGMRALAGGAELGGTRLKACRPAVR